MDSIAIESMGAACGLKPARRCARMRRMATTSPLLVQDTPTLRIGELSRLSGRSVHTIRWYEAQR